MLQPRAEAEVARVLASAIDDPQVTLEQLAAAVDHVLSMSIDGEVVSTGSGASCLGHPYHAALWLARRMIAGGTPLQAGDVVMSGALGPMRDLAPGATAAATIDGLGTVSVSRQSAL